MSENSVVFIRKGDDLNEAANKCLDELEEIVRQGDFVVVKPNLTGGGSADSGATVHPKLLEVVLSMLRKLKPRRILVAEDAGWLLNNEQIFKKLNIDSVCKKAGVELVDLTKGNYSEVRITNGMLNDSIEIADLIMECNKLIGLTTLKTHHQVGITIAMKNMFSNVPKDLKKKFHRGDLGKAVVDINLARKADFTIVDGLMGVEGLGPNRGYPVPMNLILGGADPVAVDTVGTKLMGFNPDGVLYLRYAAKRGLGIDDLKQIEIDGPAIENISKKFKSPLDQVKTRLAGKIDIVCKTECFGCMGVVATALMLCSRHYEQKLSALFKNLKIYLGKIEKLAPEEKRVATVGNCAQNCKQQGIFVPGCPPTVSKVMNAILDTQVGEGL